MFHLVLTANISVPPLQASRALAVLPPSERDDVLRYVHVRDAKMALVSRLLKRYLIARHAAQPWRLAVVARNKDTKPVFLRPDGTEPLLFNVSHQAGLVVLSAVLASNDDDDDDDNNQGQGTISEGIQVGVDVVAPRERRSRDLDIIRDEGFAGFVRMHDSVLCQREVAWLDNDALPTATTDRDVLLRYFYTLWCLREAYVKMTGEALLAPWLGDLEMRHFAPPEDVGKPDRDLSIWFEGRRVDDVDIHLVDLLDDFMICTSVRRDRQGRTLDVGAWELFDIEEAIKYGEEHADE
jgi:4'-phosphopantetheinyl transferase